MKKNPELFPRGDTKKEKLLFYQGENYRMKKVLKTRTIALLRNFCNSEKLCFTTCKIGLYLCISQTVKSDMARI